MSRETLLIVKIIFINLIVGLILLAFLSSKAELPPFPIAWETGQKIHVKFTNFNLEDRMLAINHIKSKIDSLHLDIKLIFDDNIRRADGLIEGIEIRNMDFTTTVCSKTSTFGGLTNDGKWAVWKLIRIDTTCVGGQSKDLAFWLNNILHEFNHALFMLHHQYIKGQMPIPLVLTTLEMQTQILWSFNDAWNLKRLYSRDRLLNYKRMNFRRVDIGKTVFLIHGNKSVSFLIKSQSELLPYLESLKNYKVVIK